MILLKTETLFPPQLAIGTARTYFIDRAGIEYRNRSTRLLESRQAIDEYRYDRLHIVNRAEIEYKTRSTRLLDTRQKIDEHMCVKRYTI